MTTMTLKNIPDVLYARLKLSAQANRRSMNSEALVCLESVLMPAAAVVIDRLQRARQLRAALPQNGYAPADVDALKRHGRP